jgi:hypothetical protein
MEWEKRAAAGDSGGDDDGRMSDDLTPASEVDAPNAIGRVMTGEAKKAASTSSTAVTEGWRQHLLPARMSLPPMPASPLSKDVSIAERMSRWTPKLNIKSKWARKGRTKNALFYHAISRCFHPDSCRAFLENKMRLTCVSFLSHAFAAPKSSALA